MEFFCRKLNEKEFDIFEGKQYDYETWTRLKASRNGVYIVKGRSLPRQLVKAVASHIDVSLNAQLITVE